MWHDRDVRIGITLALVSLASCIRTGTTTCGDGTICRDGTTCAVAGDRTLCVTPEQLSDCNGLAERAFCGQTQDSDRCYALDDGLVCLPIGCGNHFVDDEEREQCDDGNNVSADGCSADCLSNERCGNGVIDPLRGERCDDNNVLSHDGCSSRCDLETPAWTELLRSSSALPGGAAMTFDARRGRLVVFGGATPGPQSSTIYVQATTEWERGGWVERLTTSAPTGRQSPSLAYDDRRGVSVMFGGDRDAQYFADTWQWTGSDWSVIDAVGPTARASGALAYDPVHERMVLFGGRGKLQYADTWSLHETAASSDAAPVLEWTELVANGPPASATPSMTFDPIAGVLALVTNDEHWELDGSTWTRIGTVPARVDSPMQIVFDVGLGRRVLVGTEDGSQLAQWAWDGQAWVPLARAPVPLSSVRIAAADRVRGGVLAVIEGGVAYWNAAGDLQQVPDTPYVDPRTRMGTAAANDARRRRVIAFGGNLGNRNTPQVVGSTVAFDGFAWRTLSTTMQPSPRWEHAMATDIARDRIVLFGGRTVSGYSAETWSWDGTTWTRLAPAVSPPARAGHAMAYDPERERIVLFGGNGATGLLDDTWEWDGTTWTERQEGDKPSQRVGAALAYDPLGGGVLLFGGGQAEEQAEGHEDTWRLTATGWTQLVQVIQPPPRMRATLTWSPARRRLVLVGGETMDASGIIVRSLLTPDTWEWDGSRWRALPGTTHGVTGHAAFFTPDGGGVVAFGGNSLDLGALFGSVEYRWSDGGAYETCSSRADADGDTRTACDDPDCWSYCAPLCMPGQTGCASTSACGDATCSMLEDAWRCPADCGAAAVSCGDVVCDTGETCTAECP